MYIVEILYIKVVNVGKEIFRDRQRYAEKETKRLGRVEQEWYGSI